MIFRVLFYLVYDLVILILFFIIEWVRKVNGIKRDLEEKLRVLIKIYVVWIIFKFWII